jgi:hypothetical protein
MRWSKIRCFKPLFHFYSWYCAQQPTYNKRITLARAPKITNRLPEKWTGKIYSRVTFTTRTFPCFKELYDLFYPEGKKVVPSNIGDLLTFSPQISFVEKKLITFFPYGKQDSLR